jgi:hypothetical protein
MSSGNVVVATGGAIPPVVVGFPIIALPFSAHLGGILGGLGITGGGPHDDEWAVSVSIMFMTGFRLQASIQSITIGGRDG